MCVRDFIATSSMYALFCIRGNKVFELELELELELRTIISAPYLFGVVTFVIFAVATPNKYGDLLFESHMTSRRLRE